MDPIIAAALGALEGQGITRFACTGYCFGGKSSIIIQLGLWHLLNLFPVARAAFDLAFAGKANVVSVSHPSLLKVPEDFNVGLRSSSRSLIANRN